jgi:hypothetical protein
MEHWLVYLTWNKTAFGQAIRPPQVAPTLGGTSGSDVSLSSQCKSVRIGRDNTRQVLSSQIQSGACRDRTDDPLLAKQVLSQLS